MTPTPTRRQTLALALAAAVLPWAVLAQGTREIVEMSRGDAAAPVTLVEYASFTCPHCANFHLETLPDIKKNFIDSGKVRLVYREVYFDKAGLWASMIARCAGEDRYFGVVDLLYQKQKEWSGNDSDTLIENLYSIGRQAGLSDGDMDACMTDQKFAQALVTEYQKNAKADGIDSTPTFMIDGKKVSNMSYDKFEAALNEALDG
jgi:protein-disulfide isomerase